MQLDLAAFIFLVVSAMYFLPESWKLIDRLREYLVAQA